MSHVVDLKIEIDDLDALQLAAARVGLELRRDQKTYGWWGTSVGDYPLPEGMTAEELGKCAHAIGIPGMAGANGASLLPSQCWEVGVVESKEKPGTYRLIYDFFGNNGKRLEKLAGARCAELRKFYNVEKAKRVATRHGYRVVERRVDGGAIQLVAKGRR
jgi:hypothetical protein